MLPEKPEPSPQSSLHTSQRVWSAEPPDRDVPCMRPSTPSEASAGAPAGGSSASNSEEDEDEEDEEDDDENVVSTETSMCYNQHHVCHAPFPLRIAGLR